MFTKIYANITLGIRLFIMLFVIIAMILIMLAPGVCFWRTINGQPSSSEICSISVIFPMNIDRWNSGIHFQMRGQNVWGQLAIIILSILVALPPLVLSCILFTSNKSFTFFQMIADGIGIIGFLIFGAVETWYATGFDHMPIVIRHVNGGEFSECKGFPACEIGFIVKGWAVSAAFYFLSAILFLIDGFILFFQRRN